MNRFVTIAIIWFYSCQKIKTSIKANHWMKTRLSITKNASATTNLKLMATKRKILKRPRYSSFWTKPVFPVQITQTGSNRTEQDTIACILGANAYSCRRTDGGFDGSVWGAPGHPITLKHQSLWINWHTTWRGRMCTIYPQASFWLKSPDSNNGIWYLKLLLLFLKKAPLKF